MTQYHKITRLLLAIMLSTMLFSCHDDDALAELDFVGDSLVARWDLQASFPTSVTRNYGVSGSGIDYLESLAGRFAARSVVVISGTNDMGYPVYDSETAEAYSQRYLAAIEALGAGRVYLYSVFPRGEEFGGASLNAVIRDFNAKVKERVAERPEIVYLDVYGELERDGVLNPNYTYDGLHLNVYGYEVIAGALLSKN